MHLLFCWRNNPFLSFGSVSSGQDTDLPNALQELDLYDILSFDVELGKTLQELHALVGRKHSFGTSGNDNQDAISDLTFRGAPVEDLCLDFTLPGYPEYILNPGDETVWNISYTKFYLLNT